MTPEDYCDNKELENYYIKNKEKLFGKNFNLRWKDFCDHYLDNRRMNKLEIEYEKSTRKVTKNVSFDRNVRGEKWGKEAYKVDWSRAPKSKIKSTPPKNRPIDRNVSGGAWGRDVDDIDWTDPGSDDESDPKYDSDEEEDPDLGLFD